MKNGTYYKPYKHGTLSGAQCKIMEAVGDRAALRQICQRSGYSLSAAFTLIQGLLRDEVLEAINV